MLASKDTVKSSTGRRDVPLLALLGRVLAEVKIADIFDGDSGLDGVSYPTSNDSILREDYIVGILNILFVFS